MPVNADHVKQIAENTNRIATVMEELLADSRAARDVDVQGIIKQAMDAMRQANPVFGVAMDEMQRRIDSGETP